MKKGLCVGLVLASAALVACEKSSSHEEIPTALEAAKTTTHWYLTEATTLRVEPVSEERIAHPQEARDTSNWKGVLFRGDRVTVLRDSGNWVEIQKESGATGWVESDYLLAGDEVPQATIVENVESYIKRASAKPEDKRLDKGTLLFVLSQDDTWTEVNVGKGLTRWIETSKLVTDEKEIAVSKYIVQAKWHTTHEGSGYNGRRLEKVLDKYPDSALVNRLAEEVPFQNLQDMGYKNDPAVKPLTP